MENKESKTEEVGGGLLVASTFVSLGILVIFIWSPASFYLGKWSNYWDAKNDQPEGQVNIVDFKDNIVEDNDGKAEDACFSRAQQYFKTSEVNSAASSTSPDYSTYDCYGVKLSKIPN